MAGRVCGSRWKTPARPVPGRPREQYANKANATETIFRLIVATAAERQAVTE